MRQYKNNLFKAYKKICVQFNAYKTLSIYFLI